jgi:hypothetical protein
MSLRSRARPVCETEISPPSMSRLCTQCKILSVSQPYRALQPLTEIYFTSAESIFVINFVLVEERSVLNPRIARDTFVTIHNYIELWEVQDN